MNQMKLVVLAAVAALVAPGAVAGDDKIDGKAVWDKHCAGCHAMMAPKTADKAAWAPFVKQGVDATTASVVKGKGMMPPKGGAPSEAEVRAAVEYILDQMN